MPQNNCTPSTVYGSFVQTLFLGLTVLDFSATAGWNEQSSSLTVKLVEDPCAGVRKYLTPSYNWTAATFNGDPGFNEAPVGSAAFFKVEDFEFAGIIQSYNLSEDSSGKPILIVTLVSPSTLLEGTQIIIDGYQGSIGGMPNIINAYGFLESLTQDCPAVGGFGSLSGGFGNSRGNNRGVPWLLLKPAIQVLLGGNHSSTYSTYGGILFKQGVGTYGSITSNFYTVDISDLPTVSSIDYRISGPNASLLEIITTVCNDGGYEFYVDLLPTKGGIGAVTNIIKIRTVSRRNQPALGAITSFITQYNSGPGGKKITQDSIGRELRPEFNSAFLIGGQKRQIYQQTNNAYIEPYWGTDDAGNLNYADFDGLFADQWGVTLDVRTLNISLNTPIPSTSINVSETTLLMSQGDVESFKNWVCANASTSDIGNYIQVTLGINATVRLDADFGTLGGTPPTDSFIIGGAAAKPADDPALMDLQTLFNWLNSYTSDIYGKKWLVRIPWVCFTVDSDSGQYLWSDLPSTEGGWFESASLLGMTFPSSYTDFFADDQGKIQSIMKFTGISATNLEELSADSFVTDGTSVWVKANLIGEWVIKDGNPYALLEINNPVLTKRDKVTESYMTVLDDNFRLNNPPVTITNTVTTPDKSDIVGPGGLPLQTPVAVAVPILSNTQTYGPWLASADIYGKVYAEKDDGLVPWEYGSTAYMNLAANAKISNTITNTQTTERGAVTIAGYPAQQLGISITQTPSYISTRNILVGSSFSSNFYYINTGGVSVEAAQITNINVSVGAGGITTEYQMSSFTPVFGRFSKQNAERLKQIGQQRLQYERKLRAFADLKAKLSLGTALAGRSRVRGDALRSNSPEAHRSSAIMLLGKKFGNRNSVNIPTASMLTFYDDYNNSAMMSLDGLVTPVQKQGATTSFAEEVSPGSPKYSVQPNYTEAPPPPLTEYYPKTVNTNYLDFLANPSGALPTDKSSAPLSGHNIDSVARGTKNDIGTGLFPIPAAQQLGQFGYASDYRYLALRGPLVVHGWGYDIMGKPVPNENGDTAGIDSYYTSKTDNFKDGWLQDDTLWPVAPVDLRYDRRRGVWTIPPDFRLLKVTGAPIAPGGNGTVVVFNADDVYDGDGNTINTKTITITNITEQDTPSGSEYIAYYSNYDNEYWPIFPGAGGSGGGSGLQIKDITLGCDLAAQVTSYTNATKLAFGSGLWVTGTTGEFTVHSLPQIKIQNTNNIYNTISLTGSLNATDNGCTVIISGKPLQIKDTYGECDLNVSTDWYDTYKMEFKSGLQITQIATDQFEINAIPKFPLSGRPYNKVYLSGNLYAFSIADDLLPSCAVVLSGRPLQIIDDFGRCDIQNGLGSNAYVDTYKINFASGLYVTGADGNYTVHALHHATISGINYSDIKISGNLIGVANDCSFTISGREVQLKDSQGNCDPNSIVTTYQNFNKLDFGSGLYVTGTNGEYTVNAVHHATISGTNYSDIKISGNIAGIANGCSFTISGIPLQIIDSSGTCDLQPIVTLYQNVNKLEIGSGLYVAGADGNYSIHSVGLVNINDVYYTGIKTAGNLSALGNGCNVTLSGITGLTSGVEVVCEVSCSGNNFIVASTKTLNFDDGLLVSGTPCGPSSSPTEIREGAVVSWNSDINSNTTLPDGASHFITVNTAAGNILVTLANASSQMLYGSTIIKVTANNEVIVSGQGGSLINGNTTHTLTHLHESITLYTNGTNYYIV